MTNQQQSPDNRLTRTVHFLAIGLWLALAAIIAVKTVQNPENHSTYPLFRNAARAWWNGVNVYNPLTIDGEYRYGPSFALALCPLAWMSFRIGALIWALLNVGIAFWATAALCRRILPACSEGSPILAASAGRASHLMRDLVLIATVFPALALSLLEPNEPAGLFAGRLCGDRNCGRTVVDCRAAAGGGRRTSRSGRWPARCC